MITINDPNIIIIDNSYKLVRSHIKDNTCFRIRAVPNAVFNSMTFFYRLLLNDKVMVIEDLVIDREVIRNNISDAFNSMLIEANQYLKSINVTLNFQFEVLYPEEVTAIVEEEA